MFKRGQAAVEFLTTYSWALFILFGVVSAVYMLDLADPDRYAEPECVLDRQIACLEAQYQMNDGGGDTLRLNLRNNYPQAINVHKLRIDLDGSRINTTGDLNSSNGYVIKSGDEQVITHSFSDWSGNGYVSDSVTARLQLRLGFKPTDSGNPYNKSGYAVVRPQ